MTKENERAGRDRKEDRSELERKGVSKVRNLADKVKEKAEKELKDRETR